MKKQLVAVGAVVSSFLVVAQVQAASVIDAATKTAITGGFTDVKDTVVDLVATGYPFIIGTAVVLMSPQIVKGLLHIMGRK